MDKNVARLPVVFLWSLLLLAAGRRDKAITSLEPPGEAAGPLWRAALVAEQATAQVEGKLSRKASFQLGGVSSVVTNARERHLPHLGEGPSAEEVGGRGTGSELGARSRAESPAACAIRDFR